MGEWPKSEARTFGNATVLPRVHGFIFTAALHQKTISQSKPDLKF